MKKMIMKKITAIVMAIISILTVAAYKGNGAENMYFINGKLRAVNDYTELEGKFISSLPEKGYDSTIILDASELTTEMLESRTPEVVIIERCISIITNEHEDGDARMLNYKGNGYYIKHKAGYEDGTIMLSYFIYNPNTQYYDDIIERYDYVLATEYAD